MPSPSFCLFSDNRFFCEWYKQAVLRNWKSLMPHDPEVPALHIYGAQTAIDSQDWTIKSFFLYRHNLLKQRVHPDSHSIQTALFFVEKHLVLTSAKTEMSFLIFDKIRLRSYTTQDLHKDTINQ